MQPNMNEQEKKRQRIYDLFNVKTTPKFLSTVYKANKKKFTEKEKDSTTSIRKHANELKVHKKT